jgi:uncharacterized protein (UPF0332 family)
MIVSDSVILRLEQAKESLIEAETLKNNNLLRGAINRAYYAMFYAVMALATLKDHVTSKHSGIIAFFDKEFIKTKLFSPGLSRALHLGFDRRQSNDYGEIWDVNEEEAFSALADATAFVKAVDTYIQEWNKRAE